MELLILYVKLKKSLVEHVKSFFQNFGDRPQQY